MPPRVLVGATLFQSLDAWRGATGQETPGGSRLGVIVRAPKPLYVEIKSILSGIFRPIRGGAAAAVRSASPAPLEDSREGVGAPLRGELPGSVGS